MAIDRPGGAHTDQTITALGGPTTHRQLTPGQPTRHHQAAAEAAAPPAQPQHQCSVAALHQHVLQPVHVPVRGERRHHVRGHAQGDRPGTAVPAAEGGVPGGPLASDRVRQAGIGGDGGVPAVVVPLEQGDAPGLQLRGQGRTDVAEMPGLVHVAGDGLGALRVTQDQPVPPGVGGHPLPGGGVPEAGGQLTGAGGEPDVDRQAGLVLRMARPCGDPVCVGLPVLLDVAVVEVALVAVGPVRADHPQAVPAGGGVPLQPGPGGGGLRAHLESVHRGELCRHVGQRAQRVGLVHQDREAGRGPIDQRGLDRDGWECSGCRSGHGQRQGRRQQGGDDPAQGPVRTRCCVLFGHGGSSASP